MATPTEALTLILRYKYMEAEFYRRGLEANAAGALTLTPSQLGVLTQIEKQERAQVAALRAALGAAAPAQPEAGTTYDFTAGGTSGAKPFSGALGATGASPYTGANAVQYFKVAQLIEDFGVRAIKGQLADLLTGGASFDLALGIHATEGRHAAEIRIMRSTATRVPPTETATAYVNLIWPFIQNVGGLAYDTNATIGFTGTATDATTQAYVATLAYGVPNTGADASTRPSTSEANTVQLATSPYNVEMFDEPASAAMVESFLARFVLVVS